MSRTAQRVGLARTLARLLVSTMAVGAAVLATAGSLAAPSARAADNGDDSCLYFTEYSCAGKDLTRLSVARKVAPDRDFTSADLSYSFFYSPMPGSNFSNATIRGSFLENINLSRSNFSNAHAGETSFKGANLRNSNFTGTNLLYARLIDADLTGSDLTGVKFSGTIVYGADFSRVVGLTRQQFDEMDTIGTPEVYPPSAPEQGSPGLGSASFGSS
ncbi:pentapeptide repeat-containing protein [Gordonia soli]|uniref:Pentapeptide repeat-containing protein n=1 Tax=Gordonia soli NBRC 108243 TaxID=1223545 RepID=M0QL75_9ACTN|nr:pentapeptide repeat-containing protein [Gordonia soli]GAC69313.1 hypothetical protein GS4_23_01100 [Gordonia soli NBRC 108243]